MAPIGATDLGLQCLFSPVHLVRCPNIMVIAVYSDTDTDDWKTKSFPIFSMKTGFVYSFTKPCFLVQKGDLLSNVSVLICTRKDGMKIYMGNGTIWHAPLINIFYSRYI